MDEDNFHDYEKRVLLSTFNSHGSVEFLNSINAFKHSMTGLMAIFAEYYHLFESDYFYKIINMIRMISRNIIYSAVENENNLKDARNTPYSLRPEFGSGIKINLKAAVVTAIKTISNEIYVFDENGFCSRKGEINDYDAMNDYWCNRIRTVEYRTNEFKHKDEDYIDNAMDYFKIKILKYINAHCNIKGYMYGLLSKEYIENNCGIAIGKYFDLYEKLRQDMSEVHLSDRWFGDVLKKIEDETWKFTIMHNGIKKDECMKIIDEYVDKFKQETNEGRFRTQKEFEKIKNRDLADTVLEGVKSNIDNIEKSSEDIMKNLLSMILKIEAEEFDEK